MPSETQIQDTVTHADIRGKKQDEEPKRG